MTAPERARAWREAWRWLTLLAGGGTRPGIVGATDELGLFAVEDKLHVHDIHSTVMAMMGLDHTEVVYMHKGRPERIDLNEGHVHEPVFKDT